MADDPPHPLHPNLSLSDMGVPVAERTKPELAVVEVDHREPVKTDQPVDLGQGPFQTVGGSNIISGNEGVAGIKADIKPLPRPDLSIMAAIYSNLCPRLLPAPAVFSSMTLTLSPARFRNVWEIEAAIRSIPSSTPNPR